MTGMSVPRRYCQPTLHSQVLLYLHNMQNHIYKQNPVCSQAYAVITW